MKLEHGGDWAGFQIEYGTAPLDFSANVSPLGPPEGVVRAVEAAQIGRYPDPLCRSLRRALGERLGVPEDWILCGNGAADLIWRLAETLRPRRAVVPIPAFSEYQAALGRFGCAVTEYPTDPAEDFRLGRGILEAITPEVDLLLLCQPGNPAGRTVEPALLGEILDRCAVCGVQLAVDECFLDFLDEPEKYTLLGALEGNRLVLFRAFTKFYGMAGLRLGYCLSAQGELLERMRLGGQPWAVSTPAQEAGVAALRDRTYEQTLRRLIQTQRPLLAAGLTAAGCRVVPGEANFLLFSHPDPALDERLRRRGVLIRPCRNYRGLGEGWYRVAVRDEEDHRRLLKEMGDLSG
ncbi:MAG: aminotransferase class I/II-fold pyridoxal phosphate-dependent enzyme [Oscillospiraceae bacterium]|nr:aminotransferase class I/II-fold pyridoxal phosphate-dependent enzyme [Oscillospiraceae bacterium]